MREHRLASMLEHAVAYDRETDLIQPGLLAPPPVLGSASEYNPETGKPLGVILDNEQALDLFQQILDNPQAVICVANGAFDFLVDAVELSKRGVDVMPKIFAMYDPHGEIVHGDCDGRVFEIQLAEPLHAIAQGHLGKHALSRETIINEKTGRPGRYSLSKVTFEVLGREDAKTNDRFRLSYAQFRGVPINQLPFEARQYPIDDTNNTLEDALGQAGHIPAVHPHEWASFRVSPTEVALFCKHCKVRMAQGAPQACMRKQPRRNLCGLALQAYFAWAAHLGSAWGFHIPQDEVDKLEKRVDDARAANIAPFVAAGIIREDGTENQSVLKRLVACAYGSRDICPTCISTVNRRGEPHPGKVPSPTTNGKTLINCPDCDGVGLRLAPEVPRSDGGGVGKSRDVLNESGDELLMEYGEQPSKKIKTTYIPMLRKGRACNVCGLTGVETKYKDAHQDWCTAKNGEAGYREIPLNPYVDPLKVTLRASIEDGIHGLPRKGGVRECFQARPGYALSSVDWTAGELVTLAESCIEEVGYSRLADALNNNVDVHSALAATIAGKSYEDMLAAKKAKEKWADDLRQVGKKSNFGFGGGMAELEFVLKPCRADQDLFTPAPNGPASREKKDGSIERGFRGCRLCILMDKEDYCGRQGDKVLVYKDKPTNSPVCIRCLRAGKRAREAFFKQWPEVQELHNKVKKLIKDNGPSGTPEITYYGGVTRGDLGFCDGGNGYFQTRLARAAKAAFAQIQRECLDSTWRVRSSGMMTSAYADGPSPLLGSRAIICFHDEAITEHPLSMAHDGSYRASEIFVETLRFACPHLYQGVKADPALMLRLYKGAEAVFDANGRLVPWEPKG